MHYTCEQAVLTYLIFIFFVILPLWPKGMRRLTPTRNKVLDNMELIPMGNRSSQDQAIPGFSSKHVYFLQVFYYMNPLAVLKLLVVCSESI